MVPLTRRRLLQGVAGLATALSGCSASESRSTSVPSRERPENVESTPEHVFVRHSADTPPVWFADDDASSTPGDQPRRVRSRGFVASAETASKLRYADADGAAGARSFVDGTDFDEETLYLESRSVGECFELRLCYLTWSRQDIHTQYSSSYRDADVRCDAEARDNTSCLIRVPDVLEPEQVTSGGSGWSSNGCRYPPHLRNESGEAAEPAIQVGPIETTNNTTSGGDSS